MSLESFDMNGTREMDSYNTWECNYIMKLELSYRGIIPLGSYQEDRTIPRRWNHTMGSYQGDGIIPYHTQRFSYNIHISKQVYSK
jgi:hypothetical protein